MFSYRTLLLSRLHLLLAATLLTGIAGSATTKLGESTSVQFRMEAFNVFNHAQFFGASSVNGNISSVAFGQIVNAMPPRQVQFAVKFAF